jgi:hypothetical protein
MCQAITDPSVEAQDDVLAGAGGSGPGAAAAKGTSGTPARRYDFPVPAGRQDRSWNNDGGTVQAKSPAIQSPFYSNEEAAAFLKLSPRTLEKLRVVGGGPRFRKFGRRVFYAVCDLEEWAALRTCDSTSDPAWRSPPRAAGRS